MDVFYITYLPVLIFMVYVLACRLAIRRLRGGWREAVVALLNLTAVFVFLFHSHIYDHDKNPGMFLPYVFLALVQYLMLRLFVGRRGRLPWLAFFTPIAGLIVCKYYPGQLSAVLGWIMRDDGLRVSGLVGISYMTFRCSRLALEVRNGLVKTPGLWEYLGFAFFLPTMSVGPISTYAFYRQGFEPVPWTVPTGRALMRLLVGLVKYKFLGSVFNQLSFQEYLLNGYAHCWTDLPVAMVSYYLFLYCNFSGFCDMAIGAAGLIGIPVPENFDNPLLARNMRDFWNRWHITLSVWMRDVVFAPLSKYLVGLLGPARANHAIALTVTAVFLLIGIWHGVGWNYALFGLSQALGVVTVHYYTIFLKKKLGRDGFKAYNENRWIHGAAVVITFCYFAATLFLFANTWPQMKQIFSVLR